MALLNTAKTRLGLGGPGKNYTRPFTAKGIASVLLNFLQPLRGLEISKAGKVGNSQLYFRLEAIAIPGGGIQWLRRRRRF